MATENSIFLCLFEQNIQSMSIIQAMGQRNSTYKYLK